MRGSPPPPPCLRAQNATVHSGYNSQTFANDIAVIILKSEANTTRNAPALLPAATLNLDSKQVTVAGFGTTEKQTLSKVLKCVACRGGLAAGRAPPRLQARALPAVGAHMQLAARCPAARWSHALPGCRFDAGRPSCHSLTRRHATGTHSTGTSSECRPPRSAPVSCSAMSPPRSCSPGGRAVGRGGAAHLLGSSRGAGHQQRQRQMGAVWAENGAVGRRLADPPTWPLPCSQAARGCRAATTMPAQATLAARSSTRFVPGGRQLGLGWLVWAPCKLCRPFHVHARSPPAPRLTAPLVPALLSPPDPGQQHRPQAAGGGGVLGPQREVRVSCQGGASNSCCCPGTPGGHLPVQPPGQARPCPASSLPRRQSPFGGYSDVRKLKQWLCCQARSLLPTSACADVSATC